MSTIELELAKGAIHVEATVIAEGLGLEPARVLDHLRRGELTALCEQGIAEDAGRFRLTFFHDDRCLRVTIDRNGEILERSTARLRRRRAAASTTLKDRRVGCDSSLSFGAPEEGDDDIRSARSAAF